MYFLNTEYVIWLVIIRMQYISRFCSPCVGSLLMRLNLGIFTNSLNLGCINPCCVKIWLWWKIHVQIRNSFQEGWRAPKHIFSNVNPTPFPLKPRMEIIISNMFKQNWNYHSGFKNKSMIFILKTFLRRLPHNYESLFSI